MDKQTIIQKLRIQRPNEWKPGREHPWREVDWSAVHNLEKRAPLYVLRLDWPQDYYITVYKDGTYESHEKKVRVLGYLNADVSAVYETFGSGSKKALLIWERRFNLTASLTPEEINSL